MSILVVNSGSSSLKLSLFDSAAKDVLRSGSELRQFVNADVKLVGHRFVHGGSRFRKPVVIDKQVWSELKEISELAPLHNPRALQTYEEARAVFPNARHIGVFDTAFFSELPERAFIYAAPYEWYADWGIRRYGFHGISHEYCAQQVAGVKRIVILHLGSGCSASAVRDGKPIATSMGFTPLEGLVMATRSGSIDPGILFHTMRTRGFSVDDAEQALNKSSGLLGVSGVSSDYREVEKAAARGHPRAKLALDIYTDSIVSVVGAYSALLEGLDVLVFTGGVGENNAPLRASVCQRLAWMDLEIDPRANETCADDPHITTHSSRVLVFVIRTREDLMIARAALACH
ncbi:MAG TPA: acetate/propionate family kinase [Verrucomicrobiae bacterium]|nr:acetate/propionate family kinase [Verrucomicrobiae bacterium]